MEYNKYFPFDSYRVYQRECIEDILNQYTINYAEHYILEAGTGAGKSGIAYTVGKSLIKNKNNDNNGPPIIICTSTRILQDQYARSFKDVAPLWSSTHYQCELLPLEETSYGSRYCLGDKCPYLDKCDYRIARRTFMESKIGVLNYSYFLVDPSLSKPTLLVMDEAHNLEDILCEHQSVFISLKTINKIIDVCNEHEIDKKLLNDLLNNSKKLISIKSINEEMYKLAKNILFILDNIQTKLEKVFKRFKSNLFTDLDELNYIEAVVENKPKLKGIEISLDYCETLIDRLSKFSIENVHWIIALQEKEKIKFKPLEIDKIFQTKISAKHILYMSATICGSKQFALELGINKFKSKSLPNIFSPKNRPIHIFKCGALNAKNKKELLPKFIKTMDEIINKLSRTINSDIRGIIHSVSYENAEIIKKLSIHKKRFIIPNRSEIMNIEKILKDKPDTIILSPAIHEGIDLKDDLSRFQIFPKIPFGFLGDTWIKAKMNQNNSWYTRKAIIKLIQGSGRSIRSEDDWAITFILDSNFYRLLQNKELFPQWYLQALKFH